MQTLNPQGFTFSSTNTTNPSIIRKGKDALPIPTIPEESETQDRHSDEPVVKRVPKPHNKLVRHSSIVSTSLNERDFGGTACLRCH